MTSPLGGDRILLSAQALAMELWESTKATSVRR